MVEVPESRFVNTGEQEEVEKIVNEFLGAVYRDLIEYYGIPRHRRKIGNGLSDFEIKVCGLHEPCAVANDIVPTDDFVHMLLYQERVVAVVTETRTKSNMIRYDFFLYENLDIEEPELPEDPEGEEESEDPGRDM